jgi:hypothetical protein
VSKPSSGWRALGGGRRGRAYAPPGRRGRWRRRRRGARGCCGGRPREGPRPTRRGDGSRGGWAPAAAAASAGATPARTGTRGSRRRTAPPLKPGRIRP